MPRPPRIGRSCGLGGLASGPLVGDFADFGGGETGGGATPLVFGEGQLDHCGLAAGLLCGLGRLCRDGDFVEEGEVLGHGSYPFGWS